MCDYLLLYFFFFKQKTAYEMRISDWSSDVCSSDLSERDARRISARRDMAGRPPVRCAAAATTKVDFRSLADQGWTDDEYRDYGPKRRGRKPAPRLCRRARRLQRRARRRQPAAAGGRAHQIGRAHV